MNNAVVIVLAFVLPWLINLSVTPVVLWLARARGWYDQPNHRTIHTVATPRLGGVGIFLAAVFGVSLTAFAGHWISPGVVPPPSWDLVLAGLGVLLIHIMGLLDDFMTFKPLWKFLGQLAAALLVVLPGYYIKSIQFPGFSFDLGYFGPALTVFWIVAATNAINLIDGMDGQAGGLSLFSLLALAGFNLAMGNLMVSLAALGLAGAVVGFLHFNFPPAKIFMGDSGSLMLGYSLGVLPLLGTAGSLFDASWLFPIILLMIPALDTLSAIWRRLRDKRPISSPDKHHTHHKLLGFGLSTRQVLAILYPLAVLVSMPVWAKILWSLKNPHWVFDFWLPLGALALASSAFITLHYLNRARLQRGRQVNPPAHG